MKIAPILSMERPRKMILQLCEIDSRFGQVVAEDACLAGILQLSDDRFFQSRN